MVHELTLALMRNVGPTCGMVGAAHRAEAEAYHINGGAAEPERTVPVELQNPAGFECADGISQKPLCGHVDVNSLSFRFDIMTENKNGKEWEAILIGRIVMLAQCGINLASRTTQ